MKMRTLHTPQTPGEHLRAQACQRKRVSMQCMQRNSPRTRVLVRACDAAVLGVCECACLLPHGWVEALRTRQSRLGNTPDSWYAHTAPARFDLGRGVLGEAPATFRQHLSG
eukprot:10144191-Alexandrium_andersonii.AAC.1